MAQIPSDDLERARVMEAHIAEQEAQGRKHFVPANYSLMDALNEDGYPVPLAVLEGCGTYRVYQFDNGMCLLTGQPTGSWPGASVEWVVDDTPRPYAYCVIVALVHVETVVGGSTPFEIGAAFRSYVGDALATV